ncbi:Hypothetical_protein [Hexamita inflata]|uniref:Hypothetical_protein n=1 Tax=Hexamita inflata TaxID=28002 RepID=A0AA86PGV6_9EUKA|nr:Hypothetical protein HINF_LOCUS26734 [Hexamita inflata]
MNISTFSSVFLFQSMSTRTSFSSSGIFTQGSEINSANGISLMNVRTVFSLVCTRIAIPANAIFIFKYYVIGNSGLESGISRHGSQFSNPVLNMMFPSFNVALIVIADAHYNESKLYQQSATAVMAPIVDLMSYSRLRRTWSVKSENIAPTIICTASRSSSVYFAYSLADVGSRRQRVIWRKSALISLQSPVL